MEAFILYIAKTAICLGIFLITYTLFLRRTTFFRFNRLFLLSGFVISLILPAIRYTYEVVLPTPLINNSELTTTSSIAAEKSAIDPWTVLFVLYIIGIILLSIRNIGLYIKLQRLISKGTKSNIGDYKLIENKEIQSPFSVLNYILLSSAHLEKTEKDLILKHETTHIEQKHWIDLLCSECVLLLQWFNPLAWVYVHLLKENHEFLADKAVLDSGISPALYQAVLINQRFQGNVFTISNSFSYSKPLSRLNMMKKNRSSSWKRISALVVVPIFSIFIWASAVPTYVFQLPKDAIVKENNKDTTKIIVVGTKDTTKLNITGKILNVATIKTSNNEGKPMYIIDNEIQSDTKLQDIKPDKIESVSVLKGDPAIKEYGEKGKNGVIIIKTKLQSSQNGGPTIDSAQVNKTRLSIQVTNKDEKISVQASDKKDLTNILVILDGKEISSKEMKDLDPNTIESIDVLKDKTATDIYGDKGKNGVIRITSKKAK